eukprot:5122144-Alexandrium_andersonii.AAC.1
MCVARWLWAYQRDLVGADLHERFRARVLMCYHTLHEIMGANGMWLSAKVAEHFAKTGRQMLRAYR